MLRSDSKRHTVGEIQRLSKVNGISYEEQYNAIKDFIHVERTDPYATFYWFHLKYFGDTEPDPVEWYQRLLESVFSPECSLDDKYMILLATGVAGAWPELKAEIPVGTSKGVLFR